MDGKVFCLADEVRYIQRRTAGQDNRVVAFGQLLLLSGPISLRAADPNRMMRQRDLFMGVPGFRAFLHTILPPRRETIRSARDSASGSWVAISTVPPFP